MSCKSIYFIVFMWCVYEHSFMFWVWVFFGLLHEFFPLHVQNWLSNRFYSIALFSAVRQTHCALVACQWMTMAYTAHFLNIHRSGVLTALFCCYMVNATWSCCHLAAGSVYTILPRTSLKFYSKPHTLGTCVFSCNLQPALLAEWPGSFTCYCGNARVELIPK